MESEDRTAFRLLPKEETGAASFIRKNPSFDGRGVVLAVLDTGVDPAAAGLQGLYAWDSAYGSEKRGTDQSRAARLEQRLQLTNQRQVTTDGKRKLIEIMDCSGAGDVDTSTQRTKDAQGNILGLSGRQLKIPTSWTNPSGVFRVGVKPLFELYPKPLKERIKESRKEKLWDVPQRLANAKAHTTLAEHEREYGSAATIEKLGDRWKREELSAQLTLLKSLDKDYQDLGPSLDCIVFHDGSNWKACIDTTFEGRLEECALMSSYRVAQEYSRLTNEDMLSYSLNIHEEGAILEIVTTSGSHGTHVASIAAANFPDNPDMNGVAPGAQVVSLCIGDLRLGTMETGAALTRALNRCRELNVDLINYSYGEATHFPNSGRIIKAIEETVYKHGILFVSSAGNNGPGLSSGGCPGSTSSACLGVGAYLSPQMMSLLYSLRQELSPILYPWSARGPTSDGDLGVSVSAPGGAITSVPQWTLKGCQLQNGTSMSSPNAAGAVACLMSASKQKQVPCTPFNIRLALENTAKRTETSHDYFSTGYGLMQVEEAWGHLELQGRTVERGLIRYNVAIDGKYRGVYLREKAETDRAREFLVSVEPIFAENADNNVRVSFFKHMKLTCDKDWVEFPDSLELMNQQRQFNIRIDPRKLSPGSVNYTELRGYAENCKELGPLWRLPITVIVPERVDAEGEWKVEKKIVCSPTSCHRAFLSVPDGATWAVIKIRSHDGEKYNRYVFHAVQLVPQKSYRSTECYKMMSLSEKGECSQGLELVGGRTVELCLTKWWTSLGESELTFTVAFHGIVPLEPRITMLNTDLIKSLDVMTYLSQEELSPAVTLKQMAQPVKPMTANIRPLGERDLFSDGRRIYQLLLTYSFTLPKAGEVTAIFPPISDYLYESELDSQIWMIFNGNKQFLAAGEAYPSRYVAKIDRGEHKLMLQLRHEDESVLDKLRDLPALIQTRLEKQINLDIYPSYKSAFHASKKLQQTPLVPGSRLPIYITGISEEKLPKTAFTGCYLSGALTLPKDELGRKCSQHPFDYAIISGASNKKAVSSSAKPKTDKKATTLAETIRDVKIGWLNKATRKEADLLFAELSTDFPDYLPLLQCRLRKLCEKIQDRDRVKILELADHIISLIDRDEILKFFGAKQDIMDVGNQNKMEIEKTRNVLVEALCAKGIIQADNYMKRKLPEVAALFGDSSSIALGSPAKKPLDPEDVLEKTSPDGQADFQILDTPEGLEDAKEDDTGTEEETNETNEESKEELTGESDRVKLSDLDAIYGDLVKLVDPSDTKVLMFAAKYAACRSHFARCLRYVQKASEEKQTKWLDQLAVALCQRLGWSHIAGNFVEGNIVKYPASYRLF